MNNYLDEIDFEDKKIFMTVLSHIAHADGEFDEDEREFVESLCEINEIGDEHIDDVLREYSDEEIIDLVNSADFSKNLKLSLVRDMFTLANSDGNLSDNEVLTIAAVGEALDVPLETLEEISEWVADGIEWRLKGEEIFGELF